MTWFAQFWRSTLAKKAVMAVTGLILFGFVLTHMLGNLKLYMGSYAGGEHAGEYKMDVYGEWLREIGVPGLPESGALWIARFVLLGAVLLHMWAAWSLTRRSWKARPEKYEVTRRVQLDYAGRTMRWGGVIIALFIVYHLLHLTFGTVHPDFEPGRVYHNVVVGLSNPLVAGFYILANVALGFHLYHGLWSLFQTLGWNHPRFNPWRRNFALAFAALVTLGNVSFPIAVLAGLVS
jgi:succinate dehydrogenase / fumarate reductase cytochrome b subunit